MGSRTDEMLSCSFWRNAALRALLRLIQLVEPCRNRGLSREMHDIADRYDTRPTGEWEQ